MENQQIQHIIAMLKENYEGENPWHGRSIKSLLGDVDAAKGLKKPSATSHSIAELVYHMVTWREFTVSRLQPDEAKPVQYYEEQDWRPLDLSKKETWEEGLRLLEQSQQQLITVLEEFQDSILREPVAGRKYNFKKLLYGLVAHDVYHAGQIAYAAKL